MVTIYKLKDVLNFGKHKGETLKQAIDNDSQYIDWAFTNIEWFDLDTETMDYLKETLEDERAWDHYEYEDWN
jgi:hypothetical protein